MTGPGRVDVKAHASAAGHLLDLEPLPTSTSEGPNSKSIPTLTGRGREARELRQSHAMLGSGSAKAGAVLMQSMPLRSRKLGAEATSSSTGNRVKFWWNIEDYDFWTAEATCNSYGGRLAVLSSAAELPSALDSKVRN